MPFLQSKDPSQHDIAEELLDINMRELEDYLPGTSGTSGMQSIISTASSTHTHDDTYGSISETFTDLAFNVPNDPSFSYFLEWDINTTLLLSNNSDYTLNIYAQVEEESPGAGFEEWGINMGASAAITGIEYGNIFQVSGHGSRIEGITSSLFGTTIHLQIYNNFSVNTSQRVREWVYYGAKLLAITN